MSVKHFDTDETRSPEAREKAFFERLTPFLNTASEKLPGLRSWLYGHNLGIHSREDLARLPVLRKPELMDFQARTPPFGGFVDPDALAGNRIFLSPGPIWEPQGGETEAKAVARAMYAAGIRQGDTVHNAYSYHMTPGAFFMDEGARALGCSVFPAGTGNTDMQVDAAAVLKPKAYSGTPDFLKVILDRAEETGKDVSSIALGLVSGGALFPSLRAEYRARGIAVLQCFATAEFGVIAYESADDDGNPLPGMIVSENLLVEIVRPGTGDPVPEGEVGELVVTCLNPAYPLVRLGTGDLSAVLPGQSPCGRTNMRIKGWMGRADQRTKVKGMFIDPKQIAEIVKRHPEIAKARLVVRRDGERDVMALHVEPANEIVPEAVSASLRDITKLGGDIVIAGKGSLPNDGKVIADERDYAN
ncbi:AMP-binding protein [Corticibacterium sp. UT-5YL-CI-8]|nr:AMP-binding protein [Tianweitania sp. UT-5YL-CI-8]